MSLDAGLMGVGAKTLIGVIDVASEVEDISTKSVTKEGESRSDLASSTSSSRSISKPSGQGGNVDEKGVSE
jgi:hypothetical protein